MFEQNWSRLFCLLGLLGGAILLLAAARLSAAQEILVASDLLMAQKVLASAPLNPPAFSPAQSAIKKAALSMPILIFLMVQCRCAQVFSSGALPPPFAVAPAPRNAWLTTDRCCVTILTITFQQ